MYFVYEDLTLQNLIQLELGFTSLEFDMPAVTQGL